MFSKNKKQKKPVAVKKSSLQILWDYVQSLGIALLLALVIKTSVVEAYRIPSGSMEDTLLIGDFLLANKFLYGMRLPIPFVDIRLPSIQEPKAGNVIIFKYPQNPKLNYIKRCVAVEGQVVEIKDKRVFVDGVEFEDPPYSKHTDKRVFPSSYNLRDNMPPKRVPKGYLFVMGDNRDNSADSRFWGFLDRRLVRGKAMMIHWSWRQDPRAPKLSASDPLSIPKVIAYNLWNFPRRVRWSKLGDIIH